jgi:hypothetical protein
MSKNIITRIDLKDFPNEDGIRVSKWAEGWGIDTRPSEIYQTDKPLAEMVAWLESHGWTVVKWPADPILGIPEGARAFLGSEPLPIRKGPEIQALRRRYTQKQERYFRSRNESDPTPELTNMLSQINLAYYT